MQPSRCPCNPIAFPSIRLIKHYNTDNHFLLNKFFNFSILIKMRQPYTKSTLKEYIKSYISKNENISVISKIVAVFTSSEHNAECKSLILSDITLFNETL